MSSRSLIQLPASLPLPVLHCTKSLPVSGLTLLLILYDILRSYLTCIHIYWVNPRVLLLHSRPLDQSLLFLSHPSLRSPCLRMNSMTQVFQSGGGIPLQDLLSLCCDLLCGSFCIIQLSFEVLNSKHIHSLVFVFLTFPFVF